MKIIFFSKTPYKCFVIQDKFCSIVLMKEIDGKAYMTRRCRILGTDDGMLEVDLKDGYKYKFDAEKVFLDSKTYKNYFDRLIYIDRDHYHYVKKTFIKGDIGD